MSNLLIYGTGGVAYAKVNATSLFGFDTPPFHSWSGSTSQTNTGWTIGGGAEWALNRAWSVKAEYLYYNLGAINVIGTRPGDTVFMTNYDQRVTGSTARLGLNFKVGN
jgi:outer membrane immunogenic protein